MWRIIQIYPDFSLQRNHQAPLPQPAALPCRHRPENFDDDAVLLLSGEFGEHRERKHLGGCVLGDREVTRTEAQSLIGLREVKWDRVVNARSDACDGQVLLKLL